MPGLGYGGHGQHFVDYGHYEEFEDLGVGPAEYGDVSLSFRGLPRCCGSSARGVRRAAL